MTAPKGDDRLNTSVSCGSPISVFPACRDCLFKLARDVAVMSAGNDLEQREAAETAMRGVFEQTNGLGLTSPETANRMLSRMREITGVEDPYVDIKIKEMNLAREAFGKIEGRLKGKDLKTALTLAALGNSLDFFLPPETALHELESALEKKSFFYHDDTERLKEYLAKGPKTVVYLTDNSGEIFFDLPLYRQLSLLADQVVLAVKGGPALNDLTRKELERAGLSGHFSRVTDTGVHGVGLDWENVSPEFLDLLNGADLVLAKGMANFETMYDKGFGPVFFVFKAKCRPIQDFLQAPPDSFWALWRDRAKKS